jgi:hypothetical protein
MFPKRGARGWPFFLLLALVVGCGSNSATVTGEVTYEGQPVGGGRITFLPADGKGPAVGAQVVHGRYRIDKVLPGPKVVKVEAVKAVSFGRSSEEMQQIAEANRSKGDDTGIIERADVIPPDADGNNAAVEIKSGNQTYDIHLKRPIAKTGG